MNKSSYSTQDAELYREQLMDQFAGNALSGLLARKESYFSSDDDILAAQSYLLAKAMLVKRERRLSKT